MFHGVNVRMIARSSFMMNALSLGKTVYGNFGCQLEPFVVECTLLTCNDKSEAGPNTILFRIPTKGD